MRIAFGAAAVLVATVSVLLAAPAVAEPRLLMFEAPWCAWCEKWDEEIGIVYDRTVEGRRAPLQRIDINDDPPADIELERGARYTPTFVLVDQGREIGRIEGYPGEHFFYPMLNTLLDRLPGEPAPVPVEDPDA